MIHNREVNLPVLSVFALGKLNPDSNIEANIITSRIRSQVIVKVVFELVVVRWKRIFTESGLTEEIISAREERQEG